MSFRKMVKPQDPVEEPKKSKRSKDKQPEEDQEAAEVAGLKAEKSSKKRKEKEEATDAEAQEKKKKSKKRKDEEANGEPVGRLLCICMCFVLHVTLASQCAYGSQEENGHGSKKSKKAPKEEEQEAEEGDPNAFSNFPISSETQALLKAKGVTALFPIQAGESSTCLDAKRFAATFNHIYEGKDVIGKAKTGTGKTLSFALPLVEVMTKKPLSTRGRAPRVLVMAPTRELARQVCNEFEAIGPKLATLCIYGGTPYEPQRKLSCMSSLLQLVACNLFRLTSVESKLRAGIDVLVGTPGRIKDHLEQGTLSLGSLQ